MDLELGRFFADLPEAIVFVGHDGLIVHVNPAAISLFGFDRNELVGASVWTLTPPQDRVRHDECLRRMLETGVPRMLGDGKRLSAQKKDGTIFPALLLSISAHERLQGPLIAGVIRDLSAAEGMRASQKTIMDGQGQPERSEASPQPARARLAQHDAPQGEEGRRVGESVEGLPAEISDLSVGERDAHGRLCRQLSSVPAIIMMLSEEFEIQLINRTEFSSQAAGGVGRYAPDYLAPLAPEATKRQLEACRASRTVRRWEISRSNSGSEQWLACAVSPLRDEGFVLVASDITEVKETQAQQSMGAKLATVGEMAAGICHEINNPLMIVQGHLDMIRREIALSSTSPLMMHRRIEAIGIACSRIKDVVKGVRTFAGFDADQSETFSVHQCIEAMIDMVSGAFAGDQVRLEYEAGRDCLVRGSCGRLQQILMSLFHNARDALIGCPDTTIKVRKRLVDDRVEIDVQDNGPGVPIAIRDRVFQPFFTTKASGIGTGMGLALARKLAMEMLGSLELVPENQPGALFRLTLPVLGKATASPVEMPAARIDSNPAPAQAPQVHDVNDILRAGLRFNRLYSELLRSIEQGGKPPENLLRDVESAVSSLLAAAAQLLRSSSK